MAEKKKARASQPTGGFEVTSRVPERGSPPELSKHLMTIPGKSSNWETSRLEKGKAPLIRNKGALTSDENNSRKPFGNDAVSREDDPYQTGPKRKQAFTFGWSLEQKNRGVLWEGKNIRSYLYGPPKKAGELVGGVAGGEKERFG